MKKFLKILGILVALFVLALILVPFMYKGKLKDMAVAEANANLNAKFEMEDFGLSMFSNFPKLTATLQGVSLTGTGDFDGVPLVKAGEIATTVDLFKLINGEVVIDEIGVSDADVNVIILESGLPNYDIAKATEASGEVEVDDVEDGTPFNLSISHYYLHNINIVYDDREGKMMATLLGLNHEGSGDFTLSEFLLKTETTIDALSYQMDGDEYLKEVHVNSKLDLNMNMDEWRYTIDTSFVELNALHLGINGWLAMPADTIAMDINLATGKNSFKQLLSLVPNAYTEDFDYVQVSGKMALAAYFKGDYYSDESAMLLPAFRISTKVENASFQYPDLPEKAKDIQLDLVVNHPGGFMDNMSVNLKKAHVEFASNIMDASLYITNPETDPVVKGDVKIDIDLGSIPKIIPVEDADYYKGKILSDLSFNGSMSAVESEKYNDLEASGTVEAWDLVYNDTEIGVPVKVNHAEMVFSTTKVSLVDFDAILGESDVRASGGLRNFIPWYLSDDILYGSLNMHSKKFDLNEWMKDDESEVTDTQPAEESSGETGVLITTEPLIPFNIDFSAGATFDVLLYDNIEITDAKGKIKVQNGKLIFRKFAMNMFEGNATMNGEFDPQNPDSARYSMEIKVNKWKVAPTIKAFTTLSSLAPVLNSAIGDFSTQIDLSGALDSNFEPILSALNFSGVFRSNSLGLSSDNLEKINQITKTNSYNPLKLNDVLVGYAFRNGTLTTDPFDVNISGQKATIEGYTTLEKKINYLIDTKIKTEDMGKGVAAAGDEVVSFLEKNGNTGVEVPEEIPVKIAITGSIDSPSFKPVFGKGTTAKSVKNQAVEVMEKELEKKKEELKEDALEESKKIMEDARKQADVIMKEAKVQADRVKAEARKAANSIRAEANKQADDLEKQATNPLEKMGAKAAADKIRSEGENQAKNVENEANKQADNILKEARLQSDKILKDAEKRSQDAIKGV